MTKSACMRASLIPYPVIAIGEKKLRRLAEENPDANWLIMNSNRLQIKRKQFEKVIDELEVI